MTLDLGGVEGSSVAEVDVACAALDSVRAAIEAPMRATGSVVRIAVEMRVRIKIDPLERGSNGGF